MHRFYIPPNDWHPDALVLSGSEAHHCRNVLRMQRGERAVLFNGQGRDITAEIVDLAEEQIHFRKIHETESAPLSCRITLGQAIPKGKNMDLIVQKAVEIGAAEIVPIISDRTVVQVAEESATQKQAKWQTVAIEAAKQCGQNWLPRVRAPRAIKDVLAEFSVEAAVLSGKLPQAPPSATAASTTFDLCLIGSLQPGALHLKKILADFSAEHQRRPQSVLMLIGPEGDFTPAELAFARSHGCRPITLGPIVLRVETAAIYCLSVLSYELLCSQ
jgi:16S rRNA (uracil1498-N3)-methyltransferase